MGHEPILIPDSTLFIQLAIFMATYFVLRTLVFNPYLQLLHLRGEKTVRLKERAFEESKKAQKLREDYESLMLSERKKLSVWIEEERRKIHEEEASIVLKARTAANEQLTKVRNRLDTERGEAQTVLSSKVSEFATLITSKLLGYKVKVQAEPIKSKNTTALEDQI